MSKYKPETENKPAQTDQDMVEKIKELLKRHNCSTQEWLDHIAPEIYTDIIQPYGLAERQAGYEQGCESTSNKLEQFLLKWKQAGRKEVVDWINNLSYWNDSEWQAKTKEWGLDVPEKS